MKKVIPTNISDTNNSPQVQTNSFKLPLLTAKHPVNSLVSCQELWGELKKSHQGKPSWFVYNTERGSGCVDEAVLPRQLTTERQQQHEKLHRAHLLLSHKLYWDRGPVFSRDRERVTGNCRTGPHILSQSHWGPHKCGSEKVRIEHKRSDWKEGRTKYKTSGLKPKKRQSEWQSRNKWTERGQARVQGTQWRENR